MAWQRIGVRASLKFTQNTHREAAVVVEEVSAMKLGARHSDNEKES